MPRSFDSSAVTARSVDTAAGRQLRSPPCLAGPASIPPTTCPISIPAWATRARRDRTRRTSRPCRSWASRGAGWRSSPARCWPPGSSIAFARPGGRGIGCLGPRRGHRVGERRPAHRGRRARAGARSHRPPAIHRAAGARRTAWAARARSRSRWPRTRRRCLTMHPARPRCGSVAGASDVAAAGALARRSSSARPTDDHPEHGLPRADAGPRYACKVASSGCDAKPPSATRTLSRSTSRSARLS